MLLLNGAVPPVLCPTLLYLLLFVPCLLPSHGLKQRKQSLCHWKHSKRGFRALCEEEEGSPQRPQQRGTHGDVDKSHPLEQPERISIRHEVKSDAMGSEDEGCPQVSSTAVNLGGFVTGGSGEGSHQFKRVQKWEELSRSECSDCEIRGVLGTATRSDAGREALQSRHHRGLQVLRVESHLGVLNVASRLAVLIRQSPMLSSSLVQDGALPPGFLCEFEELVSNVQEDAARQSRQNYRDDVPVCTLALRAKQALDQREQEKHSVGSFVQAATLRPRRFKSRLQRTLAAGPNSRRDAQEPVGSRTWLSSSPGQRHQQGSSLRRSR